MNNRTFEEAFNTVFHNKITFDDFCSLDLSCEINTFTTNDGRLIYRPSDKLKDCLRFIDRVVFRNLAKDTDVVHSFIKGKSTLTAVQAHSRNKYFFITDICDFYPNVKSTDVVHILNRDKDLISISDIENYIGLIVNMTSLPGGLPVGFPTSPQLSNAFLFEFDQELKKYCIDHDLVYTRYVDDVIISSKTFEKLSELNNLIQNLLKQFASINLLLNKQKTHITHFNNKVKILGLVILPNGRVTIDAKYKKKIELALFFYSNDREKYNDFIAEVFHGDERSLFGLLHYAQSVDTAYIEKLQRKYGVYVLRKLMDDKRDD